VAKAKQSKKKQPMSTRQGVVAGVLGGTTFAALLILFGSVGWAAAAGVAAYAAGRLITPARPKTRTIRLDGINDAQLASALRDGAKKIETLKAAAAEIGTSSVKRKATAVVDVAERILEDIRNDPRDLKRGRHFLNYYLDATINIVKQYVSLSNQGVQSREIRSSMAKVDSLLDTLHAAFEKQLAILLEDDVMDLETELEVLERTIKMEGLAEDEG
jgi:5-bromo-4-chloroindolyl phosphate hydrolysis protein